MSRSTSFRAFKRALQRSILLQKHPVLREIESQERRVFLKSSFAYAATTIPLAALVTDCTTAPRGSKGAVDLLRASGGSSQAPVAVIGGGLAGLTAAYRLTRAGIPCELFEASSRIGGRVFTQDRFNAEGMFCELGGELIDSKHSEILGLAAELGIKWDDFRPYDTNVKHHQFHFGGQRYFDKDLTDACAPLASRLLADMQSVFKNMNEPAVSYTNFTPAAEKFDRISLEEYLGRMSDVEPWVRNAITIAYLTEYGLDPGEQSCINLMMLIDPIKEHGFGIFGESDEALRIHGGNSRLVEALRGAVESHVKIRLEHRLVRFEDKGSSVELTFDLGASTRTFRASRVICTVPFTVLREVEGIEAFSPLKRRTVAELGFGQNTKRMLGFNSRPWRQLQRRIPAPLPPSSGYTFTDLPTQTLWDTSRAQPGKSGIITAFLGGSAAVDPLRGSVDSVLSDLEAIYPGTRALYDGNNVLMRWPANPLFKGSYTCPRPGQYTTLVGSPKEPELGGKMLFAGEHVSEEYQGYMNGAVETGNRAAAALIAQSRSRASERRVQQAEAVV